MKIETLQPTGDTLDDVVFRCRKEIITLEEIVKELEMLK